MKKWPPPRNSGGISRLTRDGTAEPVSRDQILRHERGQGNIHFSCSADHVQDWQPYPVDPYSCYMCDHTYIYNVGFYGLAINTLNVVIVDAPCCCCLPIKNRSDLYPVPSFSYSSRQRNDFPK